MMMYANQVCFEDGSSHWRFFETKEQRDFDFNHYKGNALIRRRDFKEVTDENQNVCSQG